MRRIKIGFVLFVLLFHQAVEAQQKRPLNHQDYDGWESTSGERFTKNGEWVGFQVNIQDGDGRLEVVNYEQPNQRHVVSRAQNWQFSHDGKFAEGKILVQKDTMRNLKLKKTKTEDMPKDSLFILNLKSGGLEKLARVKSYAIPEEKGDWLAIYFEKESADKKDKSDTTKVEKEEK